MPGLTRPSAFARIVTAFVDGRAADADGAGR